MPTLSANISEEGFPPEDEPLTDEELDALNAA